MNRLGLLWEGDVPTSGENTGQAAAASIILHGTPRCELGDGRIVHLEDKDALLLAWLALEGATPRARLAALLWPEADTGHARGSLRQRLARLKRRLGFDAVAAGDVALLQDLAVARAADDSAELLAGIEPDPDSDIGMWLAGRRDADRSARTEALAALASQSEAAGELAAALRHAQALIELDPSSEHAHRRAMRLHYVRGDSGAALAAFERCKEALARTLGAAPSTETVQLAKQIAAAGRGRVLATASRAPVPVTLLRTPRLIGRDADWNALAAAWDENAAALVVGDPGMGKTRLIGDFARSRHGVLLVDARPGDARVPYALLSRLLRPALAMLAEPLPRGVVDELAGLLPELGRAQPAANGTDRARFLNAVDTALEAAVGQGLAGLVVDDLQFADTASVEVLQRLIAARVGLRWIVAYRPVELAPEAQALCDELLQASSARTRTLEPLSAAQIAELIDSLDVPELDGAGLAPALARHTGGNPLFLLETLKAMLTQGGPTQGPATGTALSLPAAANVTTLIGRRIGRLSNDAIRLARCAAVAGQDFSTELAAQVLGVRLMDLVDGWAELEAAQVLRDGAFVHDLIHDAALASVPAPIAVQLHAEIATFLEGRDADPARVAVHWLEGARPLEALPHMKRAAEAARRALMLNQAMHWYSGAVDILERAGEADAAFELWLACANMADELTNMALQAETLPRLERLAHTPVQQARAAVMRCVYIGREGRLADCLAHARRSIKLIEREQEPELYTMLEHEIIGSLLWLEHSTEANALLDAAMPHYERLMDSSRADEICVNVGVFLGQLDRREDSARLYAKAIDHSIRLGNTANRIIALVNLGANRIAVGRTGEALDALLGAWRLLNAMDPADRPPTANAAKMLGGVYRDQGDYSQAVPLLEQAVASGETQHPLFMVSFLTAQGRTYSQLGQFARARQCFEAARARPLPAPRFVVAARIAEAWLAWAMGKPAPALLDDALTHIPARSRTSLAMDVTLAQALYIDEKKACERVKQVRSEARRKQLFGTVLNAEVRLCQLYLRRGMPEQAATHARAAMAMSRSFTADDMYVGEVWLASYHALRGAEDIEAGQVLSDAVAWIRKAAETTVPPEFRDSFLNRNPVNLELLRLGARAFVAAR